MWRVRVSPSDQKKRFKLLTLSCLGSVWTLAARATSYSRAPSLHRRTSSTRCPIFWISPLRCTAPYTVLSYLRRTDVSFPCGRQSVFGYISVLPGAFSAYRYEALMNSPNGNGPLASYFKGEAMHGGTVQAGLFERNMYLAEDRILCFEIVTKKREAWTLKYVKSAKASTDVPTTVAEFISQRRRWLNGSLFASIHATIFWYRIWTSGQGFFRKLALQFEFIYNAIQLLFTWTSLANFYLAFFFVRASSIYRLIGFSNNFFHSSSNPPHQTAPTMLSTSCPKALARSSSKSSSNSTLVSSSSSSSVPLETDHKGPNGRIQSR